MSTRPKHSSLGSIQLAAQVSCSLHQLLVLLLLHLEFSLSLNADGVEVALTTSLVKTQLADSQTLQEAPGLLVLDNSRAVGDDPDLAIWLCGLLNGKHGLVHSVVSRLFQSLSLSRSCISLNALLRLRQRRRAEWQEFSRHGIDLEVDARLGSVGILDINSVHTIASPLILRSYCDLRHGAFQLVDGVRER